MQRRGDEGSIVTHEGVNEAGGEMGETSRLFVYLEYNGAGTWSWGYAH